jgi:ATP-dependent helicase/nuclease subunit B
MPVQFILGRSGTGKTNCCIKAIVNALLEPGDNRPLILLVPEQATYQAQRAVLSDERITGYSSKLNVLSFDRLQFLLLGRNTARPQLSRIGRAMAVQRILRNVSGRLKVFDLSANQPGLGRQMAELVTELHQYAKTPQDIDELLGKLSRDEPNNLTALKFADISLVFKECLNFIEAKFIDPDVQLRRTRRAIVETDFAKNAKLWVDGFAGFTTSELEILAELLKVVADAQIALCLDPSHIDLKNPDSKNADPISLFYPTQRTYTELFGIIKKLKLELAEPVILTEPARFSSCPPLAHIESTIFNHRPAVSLSFPQKKINAEDNVRIIAAPNARMEIRFVAREILKLVRNKNLRYRDIAIIAPDLARYEHYIRAYFDDYRLPFFIDKRKLLNQHPLIQLICSALRVVTGSFSGSDIFAYLKTDLVPLERRQVDLLENYCVAFGITGSDWQNAKDWHFAEPAQGRFDKQRINQIRQKVSQPLLELCSRLCPADNPQKTLTAAEFTQTIFDFLDSLGVRERMAEWIEEAAEADDHAAADEHRQVYDRLINIFDELVEVFADEQMSCDDLISIIDSAFSQLTLAFIPPSLDQVLVGAIERSRHPDLKAVFLIGATQKQFPAPVAFDGLLTDVDRSAAESADFPLAATTDEKLAERQYLAYIAFTRPAQFLYVTYPLTDDKGSAEVHSQFITNLESLFENLAPESVASQQPSVEQVHNEYELTDLLCRELGRDVSGDSTQDSQLGRLLADICADEQLTKLGSITQQAVNYDNSAELGKDVCEKFFTGQIRTSASRLSTFAACPYQHFARYILELEERQEFKFEPLDLGIFYHRVLDTFLEKMKLAKMDFATIQDQKLLELLGKSIAEFVRTDSFISNFARRSTHNMFIINCASETLEDCVLAIAQMVRAGNFRPIVSEITFGKAEGARRTLGEIQLALPNEKQLFLNGKIDRLDIAELNGKKAALVFDYKRKDKPFSWSRFYYGLEMQLPIYMLAVKNTNNRQYKTHDVAGAFYMPVETEIKSTAIDELPEKMDKFYYKAKGILNGDFFQHLDGSNSNKFYNFYVTKDGSQYGYDNISGALRPADFEKVLNFTQTQIVRLAEEILSGKIVIRPYRLSGSSPCSYCKFRSLCRFDWQINDYNTLIPLNKLSALEKMETTDG